MTDLKLNVPKSSGLGELRLTTEESPILPHQCSPPTVKDSDMPELEPESTVSYDEVLSDIIFASQTSYVPPHNADTKDEQILLINKLDGEAYAITRTEAECSLTLYEHLENNPYKTSIVVDNVHRRAFPYLVRFLRDPGNFNPAEIKDRRDMIWLKRAAVNLRITLLDNALRPLYEERIYLNALFTILEKGEKRTDRTGTGTLSIFGRTHLSFDLQGGQIPLLTTRRIYWKGVVEELLWMIRGCTDAKELAKKHVHIWDANGSREALDKLGFKNRKEGDLGPVYGFQWRHFGAKYIDCETNYKGQGVDQLQNVVSLVRKNPDSRRIVMSSWNVCDIPLMALPPCHVSAQFYVHLEEKKLSCMVYQRSADFALGVPFNIASYALLTHMIARVCKLEAKNLHYTVGDAHIYNNHVDAIKTQLAREPEAPFPIVILPANVSEIDDYITVGREAIILEDYLPQSSIDMKMSL